MTSPTASLIIIGNEILSGRTQDANINYIAQKLSHAGIKLLEVRIVPDISKSIIDAVLDLKTGYDHLFTTGGIGPTHDDITTNSIAEALGLPLELNHIALAALKNFYMVTGQEFNPSVNKMAFVPKGSLVLTDYPNGSSGFMIENIYVMAGVPAIMQIMMDQILSKLQHGKQIYNKTIEVGVSEIVIASNLTILQNEYPDVEIGSYPFKKNDKYWTSLVLTSCNLQILEKVHQKLLELLEKFVSHEEILQKS